LRLAIKEKEREGGRGEGRGERGGEGPHQYSTQIDVTVFYSEKE
jgi:hypothetical protein